MSHNIEIIEGKAQHVYVGDEPWHGLGTKVPYDLTPAQMLEAAGLDWEVGKQGIPTVDLRARLEVLLTKKHINKSDLREVMQISASLDYKDKMLLVRKSKNPAINAAWEKAGTNVLDIVGKDWNPVQNSSAAEFFHDFVMRAKMDMHTAGSLQDGKIVWMLARLKEHDFEVVKDDKIEAFMLFSNFHMYGKPTDIRDTTVRVVCNNTFDMAMQGQTTNNVRVNHRQAFDVKKVQEMVKVNMEATKRYKEQAQFLASKTAKWTTVQDYFKQVEPATTEKKREANEASSIASMFIDAFDKQPGAKMGEGTWWQAFNATTYAYDHMVGQKADSDLAARDNRLNKAWYGDSQKRKGQAMELALDFAKAA
jgi:phage/plasmid-like protein (TIGR03299 family)